MIDIQTARNAVEMPESIEEQRDFIAKIVESFEAFVEALWFPIGSWKVAPLGDVERDIIRFIQYGPPSGFQAKRGVIAFRSIGKTHFVTGAYAAWRLLRDPDTKILIISKTTPEARKTVKMVRGWFDSVWFLQHLAPNKDLKQTDNLSEIHCGPAADGRNPSISAVGITGQLPSKRAHVILADDVETKENTKSAEARAELESTLSEFRAISSYGDQEIIYVGTYHHEDSVYFKLANKGYYFQTWPKCYPAPDEEVLNLSPMMAERLAKGLAKPGDISCPHRVLPSHIETDKEEGFRYWSMQCMCLKSLGTINRYPLRLRDLIIYNVDRNKAPVSITWGTRDHNGSTRAQLPSLGLGDDALYGPVMIDAHWSAYEGPTKAAIDPAGRGSDKTGLAIGAALAGMLWIKGVYGMPGGADTDSLDLIARTLRHHNAREVTLETNNDVYGAYQNMLEVSLRKHFLKPNEDALFPDGWMCSIVTVHNTEMKEARIIDTLEPIISSHRMVMDPSTLLTNEDDMENELQYQISRLCRERHCLKEDGKIDALQMLTAALLHTTKRDTAKAAERTRERDAKEAFARMFKRNEPPREPSWIRRN